MSDVAMREWPDGRRTIVNLSDVQVFVHDASEMWVHRLEPGDIKHFRTEGPLFSYTMMTWNEPHPQIKTAPFHLIG